MFERCKFCKQEIEIVNRSLELVECLNCKLIFAKKEYSQREINDVYDRLYNAENPQYLRHAVHEFEQLKKGEIKVGYNKKRLLGKYLQGNSTVLEIGSGVGLIGAYIRTNFKTCHYTGVEIDKKTNDKAKSLGLNVFEGDFTIIESFDEKFDVVLMWEVLEHIQDLRKCISLIKDKLSKGGVFIFSVPNYDKRSNYADPMDKVFTSGPPIHLNFFRKKSIYRIFDIAGFRVEEVKKKRFPYFDPKLIAQMFMKIMTGRYEGPTIYSVIRKE